MIRLLLFCCLALATILLVQSDLATTRSQTTIRLAQDDSADTQAPDPASSSDSGPQGDDSGAPAQDQ